MIALIVVLLIIIVLYCLNRHMCHSCRREGYEKPLGMREIYLNTNSTYRPVHGKFNQSDMLYPETSQSMNDLEEVKQKLKKLVCANDEDEIIFVSSCSEAIASVFHWISLESPYTTICGTEHDHSTIRENAELYNFIYDSTSLKKRYIPDNTSCITLTHVDPTTGEIIDIENYISILSQYKFIDELVNNNEDDIGISGDKLLQYRPVTMLDATQSIGKIYIDIHGHKNEIDVVVASLHKLGFPLNFSGIIILNKSVKDRFVPLVAGSQQNGMRGGSYNPDGLIENMHLLDHRDNRESRKQKWEEAYNFFTEKGLNVYKPKGEHLYNTLLIDTNNHCTLELITELSSKYGIYLGNKTACKNEPQKRGGSKKKNNDKQTAGSKQLKPFDNAVRISFIDPVVLTRDSMEKIASEISKELASEE